MSDKIRYVRQLSPESAGEAPGRGRLQGRRILVVGGGQRTFDVATDPVGNGLVASLHRPGGNVTGPSLQTAELAGKRVELLTEIVPGLARVAVLSNSLRISFCFWAAALWTSREGARDNFSGA